MQALNERLIEYICSRNEEEEDLILDIDTELFATGYLDSIGFVGMMVLIEEELGINMDDLVVNPEQLNTVRAIGERCEKLLAAG